MLFKVRPEEPVRKSNENIDTIAEFIPCNDKTLKYVFLMYDYDSPYSRQPLEMRKDQVLVAIGYTKEESIRSFLRRNKENIEASRKAFMKLQYDFDFESLISLKIQIDQWNDLLRKTDKSEKEQGLVAKIFDKMPSYIKRVKEMEELVGYRETTEEEDESTRKTSLEEYLEERFNK